MALRLNRFGLNMAIIAILCINGIASPKPDRFLALNDIFQLRLQGVAFFLHLFGIRIEESQQPFASWRVY